MLGGISIWQLLIILVIVFMLFGTKRLRSLGGDLGGAIKGFKKAMSEDNKNPEQVEDQSAQDEVIEGESKKVKDSETVNQK